MAVFRVVSIALMMEAAGTSETSVNFYQTTTTQKTAILLMGDSMFLRNVDIYRRVYTASQLRTTS
jgi:predicted transcriptional regulator